MKRKFFLYLSFAGLFLLMGCWDQQELDDISFVMGMGVDKINPHTYRVSFQIVDPGQVSGGKKSSTGKGAAVTTYSETGSTLFDAIGNANREVPRKLDFSHTNVLILGERLARSGDLRKVLDFTERYHKFRSTTLVLIARHNHGQNVLSILNPLEKVPALKMMETLEKTARLSGTSKRNINDVILGLSNQNKGLAISGVQIVGDRDLGSTLKGMEQSVPPAVIKVNGLAVFKNGKLRTWFGPNKTRGVAWVQNKIKKAILTADCKTNKNGMAAKVLRSDTSLHVTMNKGKPMISIIIHAEANLEEVMCPIDLTKPKAVIALNHEFETKIKQEVLTAIEAAQAKKVDIFGFSEAINRADPAAWKKIQKHWDATFAKMNVQVKVNFFIRRTGLRTKPIMQR